MTTTASVSIGRWTLQLTTKRVTVHSERDVTMSDNPTGGRGTLLRTDRRTIPMTIHEVHATNDQGDEIIVRVNHQRTRTTCTRTRIQHLQDIDGKALPDKAESMTLAEASAYLARLLGIKANLVQQVILAPLPEDEPAEPKSAPKEIPCT